MGASVRASLALEGASRAWALLSGRSYVVPGGRRAAVPARRRAPAGLRRRLPRAGARRGRVRRDRGAPAAVPRARAEPGLGGRPALRSPASAAERRAAVTFPLVPRGRLIGLSFGTMRSFRRGTGSDVVDSRPYRRGDDVHSIDWAASARRSAALQQRRVHRARALRGRGAAGRDRLRPPAGDVLLLLAAAVARQAARGSGDRRAPDAERRRRRWVRRLPRPRGRDAVLGAAARRAPAARGDGEALRRGAVHRAAGQPGACARPPRRAPARRHVGRVRVRALGLPAAARPTRRGSRCSSIAGTSFRS